MGDKVKNSFVIFSGPDISDTSFLDKYDFSQCTVLAADCGTRLLNRIGVTPDVVIGDFDSSDAPDGSTGRVIKHSVKKDDTDTMLCIKYALDMGADDITIVSGIGGRLDHTVANIQSLYYILKSGAKGRIISSDDEVILISPGAYSLKKRDGFSMSLFSYSPKVFGLSIIGAEYEVRNADIDNSFPIGASNHIIEKSCEISFNSGTLLVVFSRL